MFGRHRGYLPYLKREMPNLLTIHGVIHRRQHLVARSLSSNLHESLQFVITAVNLIRSQALNSWLFARLCEENDEEFKRLVLHTEVRWLSRRSCLSRSLSLFDSIFEFSDAKDPVVKRNLHDRRSDIAYLADLHSKFNNVNLQLQGDSLNRVKTKSVLAGFRASIIPAPQLAELAVR